MADHSKIEWTDATWNPITGCSVVSAGCKHCYAMRLAGTRMRNHPSRSGLTQDSKAGPVWTGEVRFNEEWLDQPLRWCRPRRIFVCAHGDLFHNAVPDAWIDRVFAIMALSPHHTFQVLTKRAERMRAYLQQRTDELVADWRSAPMSRALVAASMARGYPLPGNAALELLDNDDNWRANAGSVRRTLGWPLRHVWLGVSAENQMAADERIPLLLQTPAAVRWVSAEPLIGPVKLAEHALHGGPGQVDWVVVGGESGPNARPMHPAWVRSIRDQCTSAGVPMLFKQWGEWAPGEVVPGGDLGGDIRQGSAAYVRADGAALDGHGRKGDSLMRRVGKKAAGRLLDGVLHEVFPVSATP